jgi:hypothetical protein
MNFPVSSYPRCPSLDECAQVQDKWVYESRKLLTFLSNHVDDADLLIRHQSIKGWRFENQALIPLTHAPVGECYVRIYKGGHRAWGRFPLVPDLWYKSIGRLIQQVQSPSIGFYKPPQPQFRHPAITLFDQRFCETLGDPYRFQRLAFAMSDNTWHEGERTLGRHQELKSVEGRIGFRVRHRIMSNFQGQVASSRVYLDGSVRLNQHFEESKQMIFAPTTYLPWALMGSTLWRKRSSLPFKLRHSEGPRAVLLHPRVIEKLIRQHFPLLCNHDYFSPDAQIAHDDFTLTHEPKIDGMIESSPFDDLGQLRQTTPLIFQGTLTAPSTIDPLCAEWTPQGLKPVLSNFFIRPGKRTHFEYLQDRHIQIERAHIEPVGEGGINQFTLTILEAIDENQELIPPQRYQLVGTLASTAQGPGLFESIQFSREVIDTGSAVLPFGACTLQLKLSRISSSIQSVQQR